MKRVVLLALALITGACSPTFYTETESMVRITFGGGGLIEAKNKEYLEIAASGKRVVVDGHVISADAFMAFSIPGACYTRNAVFSPHAASYLGLWPARTATLTLAHMLPVPLREWFKAQRAYRDWIGFPMVDYEKLRQIWPEGECAETIASLPDNKT